MPWPQVWPRRQKMPQQWILAGSAPMEEVKRTNTVMMCPNQRAGFTQYNLYAIDTNQENRNCYSCGEFGHLVRNCRNRGMENRTRERRKLEYGQNNEQKLMIKGGNGQSNLNGDRDLIIRSQ